MVQGSELAREGEIVLQFGQSEWSLTKEWVTSKFSQKVEKHVREEERDEMGQILPTDSKFDSLEFVLGLGPEF